MGKFLTFSLVLLVSLQFGCSGNEENRTEAAGEVALTDGQLEEQIEARIDSDPSLKDVDVDADADNNAVKLTGTVETQAQKSSATDLARNAHLGISVDNQIEVKPREISRSEYTEEHAREAREKATKFGDKIGSSIDDAWIHTKIVTKLIGDRDTSATKINVDVDNNIVTLRGSVPTEEEKAEAARIAKETEGVASVRNQLKVSPTS